MRFLGWILYEALNLYKLFSALQNKPPFYALFQFSVIFIKMWYLAKNVGPIWNFDTPSRRLFPESFVKIHSLTQMLLDVAQNKQF